MRCIADAACGATRLATRREKPNDTAEAMVAGFYSNTGEGKLYWNMDWIMDGAEPNWAWLSPSLTHGVVSPGQTEQVTILAITHGVAPGVYRGYVDFWEVDSHGNGVGGNYQINLGRIVIKGTP